VNRLLHDLGVVLLIIVGLCAWILWMRFIMKARQRQMARREQQQAPIQLFPDGFSQRSLEDRIREDGDLPLSILPVAQGDFYVVENECMICGAPAVVAPDLIRHREGSKYSQSCYFIKQPSTAAEVDQAIAATEASCCNAVRYRGKDPVLLVRISSASVDG
jgi:hypothetical protein